MSDKPAVGRIIGRTFVAVLQCFLEFWPDANHRITLFEIPSGFNNGTRISFRFRLNTGHWASSHQMPELVKQLSDPIVALSPSNLQWCVGHDVGRRQ
jgi:hypothetical protein